MTAHSQIKAAAADARHWLFEESLPLWADHGLDPRGGFVEALDFDGTPVDAPDTRVRVQARQTYVFALAHRLGWAPSRSDAIVRNGVDVLWRDGRRPDGLYGRRLIPGEGLTDETPDLYDMAFALLAYAWAYRTTGYEQAFEAGSELNEIIETQLKRSVFEGGYYEVLPPSPLRSQNPHMHLLEASLAWHASGADDQTAERIVDLVGFAQTRFLTPDRMAIRELYDMCGALVKEDRLEAGHQYEWVWLLTAYAQALNASEPTFCQPLYETALLLTDDTGRIPLSHHHDRTLREPVYRTWGLTEALKAHIIRAETGDGVAAARILPTYERLKADHLQNVIPGGWVDRRAADGSILSTDMPASTGYHVHMALAELIRYSEGLEAQ